MIHISLKEEVIDKIAALMTVAFGLVAALAWNDTIKMIFNTVFGEQGNIPAMVVYAVVVTVIAVIITILIARVASKIKREEEKKE